jgi:tetratricopeptide (TPR) repeat protein
VVPHDPLTTEEHVTLGEAYRGKGLYDAAEKEFQAALRRDQNHVPALVALGNLAFETGGFAAAEAYYRRALRQAPDHPHANNNLAMVYIAQGQRLEEAESLAKKALQGPSALRPYVLDTLISLYLKQDRTADAEQALDEAERSLSHDQSPLREHFKTLRAELTTRPSRH